MPIEPKNFPDNNEVNRNELSSLPEMYRLFMQAPVISCIVKGEDNIIAFANEAMLQIWGKGPEVIGKPVAEVFPEFKDQGLIQLLDQVRTSGVPFHAQESPTTYLRNGVPEIRYFNFTYQPFFENENDSKPSGVFGVAHDITEQVLYRKKIEESEEKFRNLFASINQGFCIIEVIFDENGKPHDYLFIDVNSLFEDQTGLKNAVGRRIKDLVPNIESHWIELYGQVAITGKPVHFSEGSDALGRFYEVRAYRSGNPSENKVAVLFTDVSEKRKAGLVLEQFKERFELVSKATQDAIWDWNLITDEIWWNEGFKTLFGYSEEDIEPTIISWYSRVHPEDTERVVGGIHEVIDNGGKNWDGEYRFRRKDGSYAIVFDRGYALHDKEGKPYRMLGSMQDITTRKNYEENLEEIVAERTAELSRSNENLEEFAYAASHDLKEPIRKIHFFSGRLKDELSHILNDSQTSLFTRMEKATLRMTKLIDDLLSYSQISNGAIKVSKVDLNQTVKNVLEDLEIEIENRRAKISLDDLPSVSGNERQFQQMFQNLIGNALKYSRPDADPQISIRAEVIIGKKEELPLEGGKKYHLIEIEDNGIGFDQEDAERIFNVFTRLHGNADSRGTGIGLSIVRKVTLNHNGYVKAQSEPGKGSTFSIYLPQNDPSSN